MGTFVDKLLAREWAGRVAFTLFGIVAGIPLIAPLAWPLALIALTPLALFALRAERQEIVIRGWLFGAGYMAVAWSWIFSMLPISWLGVNNHAAGLGGAIIVWLMLSIALGWVPAAWAYALARLRHQPVALVIGVASIALPLLEWLRAVVFSLFAWSPGIGVNAHFSLGAVGYGISFSPGLLWIAAVAGVAGLSAFCALTSLAIAYAVQRGYRTLAMLTMSALVVAGFFAPSAASVQVGERFAEIEGLTVALLQEDLAPTLAWDAAKARAFETSLARSLIEAAQQADIVVLPEDARFFASRELLEERDRAQLEAVLSSGVHTIESARTDTAAGVRSVIAVREGIDIVHTSEKSYLVPFGEYVPLSARIILGALGFSATLEHLEDARASYRPGRFDAFARIVEISGVRFGITECSETFSPALYRAIAAEDADVFVNLASHAWIQDGRPLLFNQMLAMAIVHSVAAGIPYVQASTGAPTVVVLPQR